MTGKEFLEKNYGNIIAIQLDKDGDLVNKVDLGDILDAFLHQNTHPTSDKYKIIEFLEKWDQDEHQDDWSEQSDDLLDSLDNRLVSGYISAKFSSCNDEAEEEALLRYAVKYYSDEFWDLK